MKFAKNNVINVMKKIILSFLWVLITFIIVLTLKACYDEIVLNTNEYSKDRVVIIEKKSKFVDYYITSRNTVVFRYSVCFNNNTGRDYIIRNGVAAARFKNEEIREWLKVKDEFIFGNTEDGRIRTGKNNIIFTFEGEYLGGQVKEQLSFPRPFLYALE